MRFHIKARFAQAPGNLMALVNICGMLLAQSVSSAVRYSVDPDRSASIRRAWSRQAPSGHAAGSDWLGTVSRNRGSSSPRLGSPFTLCVFFSLLQRGIMGTFHSVSRKHLPNHLNEFQFRWNTRKMDDGERVARAIKQMSGKRL